MPIRWEIDRGFTIGANTTQQWWWNWFGEGPNKGPVVFRASPKGHSKLSNVPTTGESRWGHGGSGSWGGRCPSLLPTLHTHDPMGVRASGV